jgi:hypothetical protein
VLAAGCGNSRTTAPNLTRPAAPTGYRTFRYPGVGLSLSVPSNWAAFHGKFPLVMVAASGGAEVALWRYRHPGPVPADPAGLARARTALLASVRAKQPGIDLLSSRTLLVNDRPAIVLEAIERIGGLLRRVRSVHLYAPGEEVVLEEYAPLPLFPSVSRDVFVPVRRSLVMVTRPLTPR